MTKSHIKLYLGGYKKAEIIYSNSSKDAAYLQFYLKTTS